MNGGGAVRMSDRVLVNVTLCEFSNNVAGREGGGMTIADDSEVSIYSSTFTTNTAKGTEGGGAIHLYFAKLTITVILFTDNTAPDGGGGVLRWEGDSTHTPVIPMTCQPDRVLSSINGRSYCVPCDESNRSCWTSSSQTTVAPMAQHSHWLCDRGHQEPLAHGNYAHFGACVATGYHHLHISGLPSVAEPGYAGVEMQVQVFKVDRYDQVMTSDSTSSLQLYSSLGESRSSDPSVTFIGSTFSVFREGISVFQFAVRPTFATVSVETGKTALYSQPKAYIAGTDSELGAKMSTHVLSIVLASGVEPPCRPGSVLILNAEMSDGIGRPGSCAPCKIGQYSSHPLSAPCKVSFCFFLFQVFVLDVLQIVLLN
jgi:hypothetical protein